MRGARSSADNDRRGARRHRLAFAVEAQEAFRVTYTIDRSNPEQIQITGTVFNDSMQDVFDVSVTAEALDARGKVVARGIAHVGARIPGRGSAPVRLQGPAGGRGGPLSSRRQRLSGPASDPRRHSARSGHAGLRRAGRVRHRRIVRHRRRPRARVRSPGRRRRPGRPPRGPAGGARRRDPDPGPPHSSSPRATSPAMAISRRRWRRRARGWGRSTSSWPTPDSGCSVASTG